MPNLLYVFGRVVKKKVGGGLSGNPFQALLMICIVAVSSVRADRKTWTGSADLKRQRNTKRGVCPLL